MSTTLGKALEDTLHDFGILGHVFAIEGGPMEITVWRSMLDSTGQVAIMAPDEEGNVDVVRVAETFDLHDLKR